MIFGVRSIDLFLSTLPICFNFTDQSTDALYSHLSLLNHYKMRLSSIALLAGATAVAADNTVTLFLPGFDAQSIEGKVIGSVRNFVWILLC